MEQSASGKIKLRVENVIQETADTKSFSFSILTGGDVPYKSGQFLTFLFDKPGGEARRNYSISSSSELNEPLTITVKRIANGEYSRWLIDHVKKGHEFVITGASGFFTLPENIHQYKKLFFFAAGSGITPIYSMLKTLLYKYPTIQIVLIYSNTSPGTTIFFEALQQLRKEFSIRLKIFFLFSTDSDLLKARLNITMVERMLKDHEVQADVTLFYLCGPFEYMRMITIALQSNGIAPGSIRKEIFHVEKPLKRPLPPDTDLHTIRGTLNGKQYEFSAQYPATILQAAQALNIPLPYSCENGQCGTCAATCIEGKVWMWYNEVLMDEEIAKGRILTCTGYAVGGDVRLTYE